MSINLQKGQKINLGKVSPGLTKGLIGLGWDVNQFDGGQDFDLDASIFMVGKSGRVENDLDFIFYNNLKHSSGSVIHTGDNRTGEGDGDDEAIKIDFTKIPNNIEKLAVSVTIHEADIRGQNFGQVENAFIRLVDEANNQEILRYDLTEDFSIETAVVFAEIYKKDGEWRFSAIGSGFKGGLAALCQRYGLEV